MLNPALRRDLVFPELDFYSLLTDKKFMDWLNAL
jgi:hypothetical protein